MRTYILTTVFFFFLYGIAKPEEPGDIPKTEEPGDIPKTEKPGQIPKPEEPGQIPKPEEPDKPSIPEQADLGNSATTSATNKPGTCPTTGLMYIGCSSCTKDDDCAGAQRCCPGAGKKCCFAVLLTG
uniref:WAP domain-containing protein n=1 Tax=Strigamia maritima TaxID=126957 RepID=T1J308_STRMM